MDTWTLLFWNPIIIPTEGREPSDMAEPPILTLVYSGQLLLNFSKVWLPLTDMFLAAQ